MEGTLNNTVPHIAVVLHVHDDPALEHQVQLWVEACRIQLLHHVAPAWAPWADPPGVFYYGKAMDLPADQAAVVGIFADAEMPDAAGYHSALGSTVIGAVDLSRSSRPSRTLSHEICEIYGNAYLDRWLPGPAAGRLYAAELCDPVQRVDYTINVELLGERASITVGDFLMPGWFERQEPGMPLRSRSWCSAVAQPFEIAPGGYQIALDQATDSILYLPARNDAIARNAIERPLSRTRSISNRIVVPHEGARR
jgi:hypothetical protein